MKLSESQSVVVKVLQPDIEMTENDVKSIGGSKLVLKRFQLKYVYELFDSVILTCHEVFLYSAFTSILISLPFDHNNNVH